MGSQNQRKTVKTRVEKWARTREPVTNIMMAISSSHTQGSYTPSRQHVPEEHLPGWACPVPACGWTRNGKGRRRGTSSNFGFCAVRQHCPSQTHSMGSSQKGEWLTKRKLGLRAGSQKTADVHFSVYFPTRLKAFKSGTTNFHLLPRWLVPGTQ